MVELSKQEAIAYRMRSLLLAGNPGKDPLGIVTWFGAMQAQDLASGKWSIGVRLDQGTEAEVDKAIESGEILRTWPMRGTIHFVPGADAAWMVRTTGANALQGLQRRWDYLGIDATICAKAVDILGESLTRTPIPRSAAIQLLHEGGVDASGQRAYHLLWYTSQVGVACIGPSIGKEQTFVSLPEFAPKGPQLEYEEAVAELARRYFRSHGPALQSDFAGWAAISAKDAKNAIAELGDELAPVSVEDQKMIMQAEALDTTAPKPNRVHLLPGFDEFILGYKNRDLVLDPAFKNEIVPGGNGVFKPTVVDAGRVVGIWARTERVKTVAVKLTPLTTFTKAQLKKISLPLADYSNYVGKPAGLVN